MKRVESGLGEGLAGVEIKPADVKPLMAALMEAARAATDGHADALADHFQRALRELEEARRSPTRGTETNLARWKFWAVVAVVGLAIAGAVLLCIFLAPSCPAWVALMVGSMGALAAASREFC